MSKDHGRIVWHFGRRYLWSFNEIGRLSLVSVERINAAVSEVREALRSRGLDGEQQV